MAFYTETIENNFIVLYEQPGCSPFLEIFSLAFLFSYLLL